MQNEDVDVQLYVKNVLEKKVSINTGKNNISYFTDFDPHWLPLNFGFVPYPSYAWKITISYCTYENYLYSKSKNKL